MIRFFILCLITVIAFSCEKDLQTIPAEHERRSSLCLTTDCVTEGNVNVKDKYGQLDARVVQSSSVFKDSLRRFLAPRLENMAGGVLPAWKLMEVDELAGGELLQIYVPMITEQSTHLDGLLAVTANNSIDQYSFNFFSRDQLIDLPALAVRDLTTYGPTAQYDRGAALALFCGFNSARFGTVDADLHAQLAYKDAIPGKDDCVVRNYIVTSCFSVYGGANRERYLYTDCKSHIEYGVGAGDCDIVSRGGSGGGSGGGGSRGGLGNGNGSSGSTTYVNNRDRCAEDGVGCEEDEREKPKKERAPDTVVLDVDCKTHPCLCESTDRVTLMNGVGRIGNMLHTVFGTDTKIDVVITTSDKTNEPIDPSTWATTTSQGSPDGMFFTAYITFNVDKFKFCSRAAFSQPYYMNQSIVILTLEEMLYRLKTFSVSFLFGVEAQTMLLNTKYLQKSMYQ